MIVGFLAVPTVALAATVCWDILLDAVIWC